MLAAGVVESITSHVVEAAPGQTSTRSTRVSMVGDSLTFGSAYYQANAFTDVGWAGSVIDAYGSRGIRTKIPADKHNGLRAVDSIRATAGDSNLWIVALGTNDSGIYSASHYPDLLNMMMDQIGDACRVMWVNIYLPALPKRQRAWNAALDDAAAAHNDRVFVHDWASIVADHDEWMFTDGIHNTAIGYQRRADSVAAASRSLDQFLANDRYKIRYS